MVRALSVPGTAGKRRHGQVYRAHDPTLILDVALKVLHENDPKVVLRFLQEARLQARIEHPHICRLNQAYQANPLLRWDAP